MVNNEYPCNVEQGFNYNKNKQVPFGFLDALTIGTEQLAADIQVKTPDGDLNAVAVIEHTERAVQPTDATKYIMRLSVANQRKISRLCK
ncbi:hypothetical protein [Piscirickettsia litoralis]|uniref:Uncharacterized protein n=1 Tax=Piscirickettsia litoralis TaxID=1891921 RepID=A0ABX3A190_9GAMM|nr:hypothetical protein [Piscirickettsia litoralis]ODN42213.1 hypothetical protein BGC07_03765 [Piscirickettsia litoralis]